MIDTLIGIFIFLFGAIIGSFLNVVALRYRSGRTLRGRSMCFTCGKTLTPFELVPIASFLTQRGRCTECKAPISPQYIIVEVLTGFLFVFLFYRFGFLLMGTPLLFSILFIYYGFIVSVLVVMSVYDIRHQILPDGLTFLFAATAFIGMFFFVPNSSLALHIPSWQQFVAGIILPAPFSLIWLVSKGKWMGLGDAKLMVGIGFLLGLSSGLTAILLAFWIGAAFGICVLIVSAFTSSSRKAKAKLKMAIPFGPFLALGTVLVILLQLDFGTILRILTFS